MKNALYLQCPDCLAYYPYGYEHVSPPWLKAIIAKNKQDIYMETCLMVKAGINL